MEGSAMVMARIAVASRRAAASASPIKKLSPRDIVIQNGTRHAWRDKSTKPATMLFVLVGATRT
jgi:hypothetical protein